LIAEGHVLLNKTIGNLREDVDEFRKENAEEHAILNNRIDEFRKENTEEHGEILSAIKFSYAELDHRIVALEEKFASIEKRVSRLESPH